MKILNRLCWSHAWRRLRAVPVQAGARWATSWRDALASTIAGLMAWGISVHLFGHTHPVFAAISAIVCLSPGLPSHGRQAVGLMVGVTTGIIVGELVWMLPDTYPLVRMAVAIFGAMVAASSFGLSAVVPIQAGVSVVLVLTTGPASAGMVRLIDVGVGVGIGLAFSQILMTPNPVQQIDTAARDLLDKLTAGLNQSVQALAASDVHRAQVALQTLSRAHDSLNALEAGIDSARYEARWSLRGRFVAKQVDRMAGRYDRHAIRLYASALLLSESLASALRRAPQQIPLVLRQRLASVVAMCEALAAGGSMAEPMAAPDDTMVNTWAPPWQTCVAQLLAVEDALVSFRNSALPSAGSDVVSPVT